MGKINQVVESWGQALTSLNQTLNSHAQAIARMEVQMKKMANQIEEEELQRQSVANLDGHYMVDENTSYHEQAITTIKNGEVVETHMEKRKEEQKETIKVENFLVYSPHSITVHDSLPDEKLFKKNQRDLPRYADI